MARKHQLRQQRTGTVINLTSKKAEKRGYEWSKEEYRVIARNLADYFSILEEWWQQENRSEEEENL